MFCGHFLQIVYFLGGGGVGFRKQGVQGLGRGFEQHFAKMATKWVGPHSVIFNICRVLPLSTFTPRLPHPFHLQVTPETTESSRSSKQNLPKFRLDHRVERTAEFRCVAGDPKHGCTDLFITVRFQETAFTCQSVFQRVFVRLIQTLAATFVDHGNQIHLKRFASSTSGCQRNEHRSLCNWRTQQLFDKQWKHDQHSELCFARCIGKGSEQIFVQTPGHKSGHIGKDTVSRKGQEGSISTSEHNAECSCI